MSFLESPCAPVCQNLGYCECSPTCACVCPPGYYGQDCSIQQNGLGTNVEIFWPLTSDTIGALAARNFYADDMSGNENNLNLTNAAFAQGPVELSGGAADYTAIYFNGERAAALGQASFAPAISSASSFTIILYFRYTHEPTDKQVPLLSFSSPNGSPLSATSFFLDDSTGHIMYNPGQFLLHHEGTLLTEDWGDWIAIKIAYNASSGMMGSSGNNEHPLMSSPVSIVPTTEFFLGLRDDTDTIADMEVTCIGIYNTLYTPALANQHSKSCAIATKQSN